ncbi:hypothetical protein [Patulibacter minatonensis]|uniref:hypothetical protein n=1 Tax=Patulibacter minatonensis TaxID=298163 RepID=UPI00047EF35F|nr:hypothetical protein [Patulibacter minatonensis]
MPDPQNTPEWWPTLTSVAALLRARTVEAGRGGDYVDTFTTKTSPTAAQVTALIALAGSELTEAVEGRAPCTASLELRAASFMTYRAAQLVEMSYRPEASVENTTLAAQLGRLAEEKLAAAKFEITDRCPLPDDEAEHPSVSRFGPAVRGTGCRTVGRLTRW